MMMGQDIAEHESAGLQMRRQLMGAPFVADRGMPVVDRDEDADDRVWMPELLRRQRCGRRG